MSFNLFVKKNDFVEANFYMYADDKVNLFFHSETKAGIKIAFDYRNEVMRRISKEDEEITEEIKDDEGNPIATALDVEKLTKESTQGNDSISIENGVAQFVFKEENIIEVKIKFKNPSHEEITSMISMATVITDQGLHLDFNRYDDIRVRKLLKSWNFKDKDENGNEIQIPVNDKNVSALHPKVFNAILFYLNTKVGSYTQGYA